ncbi:Protoporphyrinogen oxidase 2-like protein [Drosera capensis]
MVADDDKTPTSVLSGKRVAVVGAGVSGLAAAYNLKSKGVNVTLLEADKRAGGKIRTVRQNGFIWEEGANTMTESEDAVTDLLNDLKLRKKLQVPIAQNKRYIATDGLLMLLPSDPFALIGSRVLSAPAKIRILLEPILCMKFDFWESDDHADESVGDFFQRHFGREFVDNLIDPFLAGTCGGDPQSVSVSDFTHFTVPLLSLSFCFLFHLFRIFPLFLHRFVMLFRSCGIWIRDLSPISFGSIIRGAIRSKKKDEEERYLRTPKRRGSFSFKGGMQTLVETLCEQFTAMELKLQAKVLSLAYYDGKSSLPGTWSLSYKASNSKQNASFDAVVMTAPLSDVKEMNIRKSRKFFSLDFLPKVDYLPLSVIVTAFKKSNVRSPLEGFGVLIPSKEEQNGLKSLGTLFSSVMFPDRAPSDVHVYTTFVGGSRSRELAKASTGELKKIVCSDLELLLGAEGEPTMVSHFYWSKAFPLYGRDYDSVVKAIEKMEHDLPGFFYAGNHRDGLSVGKAIASGCKAADMVLSYLLESSPANKGARR